MLSRYAKFIKLNDNDYAIFNNLKLDIFIVDKYLKEEIFNEKVTDKKIISDLYDSKIYVDNNEEDSNLLEEVKNPFESTMGVVKVLYLIVTDDCNLRCKYCFLENNPNCSKKRRVMDKEIAFTAIDKFADNLIKNGEKDGLIMFYGGEPTLNFDLIKKVVEYTKKYDIKFDFNMISNGTLLTEKMVDYIKENNISLGISLDGPKNITNENRKFRNSDIGVFEKVWDTKKMLDSKNCEYALSMVVSDYFLKNKEEVFNWLRKNGTKSIFYNLLHHDKPMSNAEEYALDTAKFMIESFDKLSDTYICDSRLQRQINSFYNKDFVYSDCGAIGFKQLTVLPNGDLTICHADLSNKDRHVGNIMTTSIEEINKTKEAEFFKSRYTLLNEECLNCEALFCCGGGCPNHAGILYGDRNEIERPFCNYIKEVLKWMIIKSFELEKGGVTNEENK